MSNCKHNYNLSLSQPHKRKEKISVLRFNDIKLNDAIVNFNEANNTFFPSFTIIAPNCYVFCNDKYLIVNKDIYDLSHDHTQYRTAIIDGMLTLCRIPKIIKANDQFTIIIRSDSYSVDFLYNGIIFASVIQN